MAPTARPVMRPLVLALTASFLVACTSSRETADRDGGYQIAESSDGSVSIAIDPDDPAALMAALQAAAALTTSEAWVPPARAGDLVQIDSTDLGRNGVSYRYAFGSGRFDVYVYTHAADVDHQLDETERALATLIERRRIDGFRRLDRSSRTVAWRDGEATLHRVQFEETIDGQPWDSLMYLLRDGDGPRWVKVRASFPRGDRDLAELDILVEGVLAG